MIRTKIMASNDNAYQILLRKVKDKDLEICLENPKRNFIVVKVAQADNAVLYELLELGGMLERDIRYDLD